MSGKMTFYIFSSEQFTMDRRTLIKKSAIATLGLSLSPALLISLESCAEKRPTNDNPIYLNKEQFDTIWQIAELVLPATDTPGADDAKVAPFIDQLFGEYFDDQIKMDYLEGLSSFMLNCQNDMGNSFIDLNQEEQLKYLTLMDEDEAEDSFFRSIKGIILWAYFTSEPGMKSMNYLPVPGRFNGCIEIDENEKNLVGNR